MKLLKFRKLVDDESELYYCKTSLSYQNNLQQENVICIKPPKI